MRTEFAVHMLNEQGKDKAHRIAIAFNNLLDELEYLTDGVYSREMSIVRMKLEEASFFAKKAMAVQRDNQQV